MRINAGVLIFALWGMGCGPMDGAPDEWASLESALGEGLLVKDFLVGI